MDEQRTNNTDSYNYTVMMQELFWGKESNMRNFYCREDVESALASTKAVENQEDAYRFRKKDLDVVCRGLGLDADRLLQDRSLLEPVPTREQVRDSLLESLHGAYLSFPSSTKYMDRIVGRLAPECRESSTRVTILKKFIIGTGESGLFQTKAILDWCVKRMDAKEREAYEKAAGEKKLRLSIAKLDDCIFSGSHMDLEIGKLETLQLMADQAYRCMGDPGILDVDGNACQFPGDLPISDKAKDAIRRYLKNAGMKPSQKAGVTHMLDKIAKNAGRKFKEEDFERQIGPFFQDIEESYSKQMKSMYYTDQKGERKKVYERFKTARRDRRRKKEKEWELLRICSDLAEGVFKTNRRKTRAYLYYFAFMFEMSVQLDGRHPCANERDISKNLFGDYYSDNLIRYLEDSYNDQKSAAGYEKEPAGDGINFKNFIEVIYIYYLEHKEISNCPGERIKKAEKMIEKCRRDAKSAKYKKELLNETIQEHTKHYKNMYLNLVYDLDESELESFILYNYLVLPSDDTKESRMEIASEEFTAYGEINSSLEELEEYCAMASSISQKLVEANFDKKDERRAFIEEVRMTYDVIFDWNHLSDLLHEKYARDRKFLRVIDALTERLSVNFNSFGARNKGFLSQLLHMLYHKTDSAHPMRMERARESMQKTHAAANGVMVTNGIELLSQMGFDVHRGKSPSGESTFWMENRDYENKTLQVVIRRIKSKYKDPDDQDIRILLDELLNRHYLPAEKITRSTFLSIYASYYKTLLYESRPV